MKEKAIVFDLDGTLWDATKVLIQAWNFVLKKHNLKEVGYETFCSLMGMTNDEISKAGIYSEIPEEDREKIIKEAEQLSSLFLKRSNLKPYDGLKESLDRLVQDFDFYIVSNCYKGYIETFIEVTKYGYYFDDFICEEETKLSKAQNINIVLQRNRIASAVFVGDRESDKEAAEKAKLPFIHAAYGFDKNVKTQYKIDSPKDLVDVINKIYGTNY